MKKITILLSLIGCLENLQAQVGVGTPLPNNSSQLDVVANDRGILIPRVSLQSTTDTSTITNGNVLSLLVFNLTAVNDISQGYHYWDGTKWQQIITLDDLVVSTGFGAPTNTNPSNPSAGNIYVDETTGELYTFNGTSWINNTTANNGLTFTTDAGIQLGGTLIKPTTITTTNTNTLAVEGLEQAIDINDIAIMAIDKNTNVVRTTTPSSLLKREEVLVIADEMQTQFTTPLPISDTKKIDVYRNGVKIDFTQLDTNTLELETGVFCYENDEIRIVQYH